MSTFPALARVNREIVRLEAQVRRIPDQPTEDRLADLRRQRTEIFRAAAIDILGKHRVEDCDAWAPDYLAATLRHHGPDGVALVRAYYGEADARSPSEIVETLVGKPKPRNPWDFRPNPRGVPYKSGGE